jgi:hypothetical protein
MAKNCQLGYYDDGDGTKTPPNAPHCLLLWRKPPPAMSAEAFFKSVFELWRRKGFDTYLRKAFTGSAFTGKTIKNELPFPTVDSTQIRP